MTKLKVITSPSGARFTVAADYADKFTGLIGDLEAQGYGINAKASGGYNPRNIRGTNKPSNHAFGRAVDINWDRNALGTNGDIPAEVARSLAAKHGMTWGGDWSRPDPMHFEVAKAGPVPMGQRSLTAFAGVSKTQPPTTGTPQPMPNMLDVGGQAPVMDPAEVARRQQMAKMLMQNGQDTGNMRHWTQALGAVLNSGAGVYQGKQAAEGLAKGQQSGNDALAQLLMGGDASAAMANPYSSEKAMKYQQEQQLLNAKTSAAERLQRAKIEAQNADPYRQLQMEKLRAETEALKNKGVVDQSRLQQLEQLGLEPDSPEGMMFLSNGKLPAEAFKLAKAKEQRRQSADKIAAGLKNLSSLTTKYDDPSFSNSVGPWQGSNPDGSLLSAPVANIARGFGEIANSWQGGKYAPTEVRSEVASNTEALAAAIKPLIRGPGEGPWTDADQARLVAIVGDLATSRDKEEFNRRLGNVRDALKANFDLDIPFEAAAPSNEVMLPPVDVPQQATPSVPVNRSGRGMTGQPAQSAKPRAVNPQTGETIEWNGTAWVKAQ